MVKVSGVSTSGVPGGFVSMPGATYVGDSKLLGLSIFLDGSLSSTVLIKFAEHKPHKYEFSEFSKVIDYFKDFSQGNSCQYESSTPDSANVSIVLLESNRVMVHWEESRITLLPLDFMLVLNVLQAIEKKLKKMIARRNERRALLKQDDILENLRPWWGFIIFAFLTFIDFGLMIGIFYRPELFYSFTVLTLILAVWLLFLRPEWSFRVIPALQSYFNERFLGDLSSLKSSQKNLGIVICLILLLVFYIYFGWEFISMVISFFKGNTSI